MLCNDKIKSYAAAVLFKMDEEKITADEVFDRFFSRFTPSDRKRIKLAMAKYYNRK